MNTPSESSLHLAAQCWQDERNAKTIMDVNLAISFAERYDVLAKKVDDLEKIIAEEISENDEFGSEFVIARILRDEKDALTKELAETKAKLWVAKDSALRTYDGLAQKADKYDALFSRNAKLVEALENCRNAVALDAIEHIIDEALTWRP